MPIVLPPVSNSYGLTLEEIIDQVADALRNSSIQSKIIRWLNMGLLDISARYVFGTLHANATKLTDPGVPDALLESDFHWLKTIAIPSQNVKLYPVDEQRVSEAHPDYRTRTGNVSRYYLNGNYLGLYLVPSDAWTLEYSYQRRPNKLSESDLTVYPDLPPEWHALLAQKAVTFGSFSEGDKEGHAESLRAENILMRGLGTVVYRRGDAMTVLSGPTSAGRPARPTLPATYPSN